MLHQVPLGSRNITPSFPIIAGSESPALRFRCAQSLLGAPDGVLVALLDAAAFFSGICVGEGDSAAFAASLCGVVSRLCALLWFGVTTNKTASKMTLMPMLFMRDSPPSEGF